MLTLLSCQSRVVTVTDPILRTRVANYTHTEETTARISCQEMAHEMFFVIEGHNATKGYTQMAWVSYAEIESLA